MTSAAAGARLDGSFVPVPAPGVVAVAAGREAILVDEGTGKLHLLNATGALLWACFDGTSTVEDICTDVADLLGAPYDEVLADTLAAVEGLVAAGLLGRRDAPPDQAVDVPRRPRLLEEPPSS